MHRVLSRPVCDECAIEVELFKEMANVARCTHRAARRPVKVVRAR